MKTGAYVVVCKYVDTHVRVKCVQVVMCKKVHTCRSRSEQAPGSVFHPRDESEKINCDFLGPFWYNIKLDPER